MSWTVWCSGAEENELETAYILKVEPPGLGDGLDVRCEESANSKKFIM